MKNGLTELIIVLDRSGSMQTTWEDAVGGLQRLFEEQRKVPGELKVSLTVFDTEYDILYSGKPLGDVAEDPFCGSAVFPRGATALYDAVGRTITEVGARLRAAPEDQRPERVMLVIITDGHEQRAPQLPIRWRRHVQRRKLMDQKRLLEHKGHEIVIAEYGDADNVAVECVTCGCVLLDLDHGEVLFKERLDNSVKVSDDPAPGDWKRVPGEPYRLFDKRQKIIFGALRQNSDVVAGKILDEGSDEVVGLVLEFTTSDDERAYYLVFRDAPIVLQHIPYREARHAELSFLRSLTRDDIKMYATNSLKVDRMFSR